MMKGYIKMGSKDKANEIFFKIRSGNHFNKFLTILKDKNMKLDTVSYNHLLESSIQS